MARDARASELEETKSLLESAHGEVADLTARNAASQAQLEGANQQLTFVKSQLAQAQHAEQIRIERERERAAPRLNRSVRPMPKPPKSSVSSRRLV